MQRDAPGAVSYVEGQIARLLSGRVELWELVMTGGLWRVTGQQLEKAAAAASAGVAASRALGVRHGVSNGCHVTEVSCRVVSCVWCDPEGGRGGGLSSNATHT